MIFIINQKLYSQSGNDILNILVKNKIIAQNNVDSLRGNPAVDNRRDLPDKKFTLDFEFRPRAEYRYGTQQLPNDTVNASFFVNQRSRMNLNYVYFNKIALCFSVQDLRIWGQQDPKAGTPSTLQVFEAWIEPFVAKNLSVRIGRQKIVYDNQRLFAENDWRISGNSHDAVNFRYRTPELSAELILAFNQSGEKVFGTDYTPEGFNQYKFLGSGYLKYKYSENLIITTIHAADGYQDKKNAEAMNIRFTDGGRIEFLRNSFYLTCSGYFQWGKNPGGKDLAAWYMQPEVRDRLPGTLTCRFGAELFSGLKSSFSSMDRSFVPLYGSSHRFNGTLDLITKFPSDLGNAGLINPYFFVSRGIGKKTEVRADFHTFHSMQIYLQNDIPSKRYLGFENDWLVTFRPNTSTRLDAGISYARFTESFEFIKGSSPGSHDHTPYRVYISVTFRPVIFSTLYK